MTDDFSQITLDPPIETSDGLYLIETLLHSEPIKLCVSNVPIPSIFRSNLNEHTQNNRMAHAIEIETGIYPELNAISLNTSIAAQIDMLEYICSKRISEQSSKWFQSFIAPETIQCSFIPSVRVRNISGHCSIVLQTVMDSHIRNKISALCEDFNHSPVNIDASFIVKGVQLTRRSFQLVIETVNVDATSTNEQLILNEFTEHTETENNEITVTPSDACDVKTIVLDENMHTLSHLNVEKNEDELIIEQPKLAKKFETEIDTEIPIDPTVKISQKDTNNQKDNFIEINTPTLDFDDITSKSINDEYAEIRTQSPNPTISLNFGSSPKLDPNLGPSPINFENDVESISAFDIEELVF
jgi:hypothetical protein